MTHKKNFCGDTISQGSQTYTHAKPGVFLSVTHFVITPELCGLGKLQTKTYFCLLDVNPIWLLAVTQLYIITTKLFTTTLLPPHSLAPLTEQRNSGRV